MPRVAGIYSTPVGTDGIPNNTIESAKYNTNVHDVEFDLNAPRPIVAGGTGASTGPAALANLGGEAAGQFVTNYDTYQFLSGSFYSSPGATSAPDSSNYWLGVSYMTGINVFLEARSMGGGSAPTVPNPVYVRQKLNGTWGPWVLSNQTTIDLANNKVAKAGDTMSGALTVNAPVTVNAALTVSGDINGGQNFIGAGNVVLATTGAAGLFLRPNGVGNSAGQITMVGATTAVTSTTASTSPSTGALTIGGGLGVQGTVRVGVTYEPGIYAGAQMQIGHPQYGLLFRPTQDGSAFACIFVNAANSAVVGFIQTNATTTTYNTASDAALKEDFKSFDAGIIVDNTTVYDYAWRSTKERAYGVIAQQAKEIYPAAFTQDNERWFVDYSKYVPVLLQELQALRARVAQLEAGTKPAPLQT